MNILIIGSGGREHAIAWKVSQSKIVSKIYAIPGNPGISKEKKVENFEIENPSIQDYIRFAKSKNTGIKFSWSCNGFRCILSIYR